MHASQRSKAMAVGSPQWPSRATASTQSETPCKFDGQRQIEADWNETRGLGPGCARVGLLELLTLKLRDKSTVATII
jgi:hypothetical protein